jgi:hypothetical protein
MRRITIDPQLRRAYVEAGVLMQDLVEAAAEHGLATLAGSSPNIGVVGYTLGGGLSFLSRKYGLACNAVHTIKLVTADGHRHRADHDTEPDLFWALRGGGGSFGVVTALDLQLFPITSVYAGALWYPIDRGADVLHAWRDLTDGNPPDELTTIARFLNLPDIPDILPPLRRKSFVSEQCGNSWAALEADPRPADPIDQQLPSFRKLRLPAGRQARGWRCVSASTAQTGRCL